MAMPFATETNRPLRFSTGDLAAADRIHAVRALRDRGILPIEPLPDRAVHVHIAKWILPGAGILAGTLCGLRQDGSRQVAGLEDVFFGVNLAGRSVARQRGRELLLDHGAAILLSCAEGDFTLVRPTPVRFVGLRVPRNAVAALARGLDDAGMRSIPRDTEALRILSRYLDAILHDEALASPELSSSVASHLHDLIALSVGASRDGAAVAQARGVVAARLQAIKSDIVANLGDCSLTLAAVAARHAVTPRYVHKLFDSEDTTFTQFVLHQRLGRAYRMLRNPRFAARSISAIAFDVGFGDISYFNRAFRRRYAATPSDVRAGGRS